MIKQVREGMYDIGTIKDGDITSWLIVNLNNGTVVFNNSNRGNAGVWTDIIKITDIMKETRKQDFSFKNEPWYKLYKKFIQQVNKEEFNTMIDKMNKGLI